MKKIILIIAFLGMCFSENVSVLTFEGKSVSVSDCEAITELFISGLARESSFQVIDRANMNKTLEEQSFQNSGCTDTQCAVEIGKLINVDYIFTGTVSKLDKKYYITVSSISIETGKIGSPLKYGGEIGNKKLLSTLSLSSFAGGTVIASIGYFQFKTAKDNYDNATSDFENLFNLYSKSGANRNVYYSIGGAFGLVFIITGALWLSTDDFDGAVNKLLKQITKKEIVFIPTISKDQIVLALQYEY
jgi:TolB-like protein